MAPCSTVVNCESSVCFISALAKFFLNRLLHVLDNQFVAKSAATMAQHTPSYVNVKNPVNCPAKSTIIRGALVVAAPDAASLAAPASIPLPDVVAILNASAARVRPPAIAIDRPIVRCPPTRESRNESSDVHRRGNESRNESSDVHRAHELDPARTIDAAFLPRVPSRPSPPSRAVAVPVADAHRHENNQSAINQSFGTLLRRVARVCDGRGLSYIHRLSESHV